MAAFLRAMVTLLNCAIVIGVSASASSGEGAEIPLHPVKRHSHHRQQHRHHHHSADAGSAQLIAQDGSNAEDGVQLSIAAKGGLERNGPRDGHGIVRREATEDEEEPEMDVHRYATSSTHRPQPFSAMLQAEPHISCGKHMATECAACVLSHGPDWCHGDCKWDDDKSECVWNDQTTEVTSTTDKYPGVDESAMSDDAIANKLREEQEAAEEQERIDRNKFWATVGISAGGSAVLIMTCGLFAICFVLRRDAKAAEPKVLEEEPVEGDAQEGEEGDEKAGSEAIASDAEKDV